MTSIFLGVTGAWESPIYPGYSRVWQDTFSGLPGASPDLRNWNIITGDLGVNNELQFYTGSSANAHVSGSGTLKLVPWKDSSHLKGWTSGRIESKYTFTPLDGNITRIEAYIMLGDGESSHKQGIWPAFWMLGDSMRSGVAWPTCGEIDIMETINGALTGYGSIHCDICAGGITGTARIPDHNWHLWRLEIDRRDIDYQNQAITWYMGESQFHQVTGTQIGSNKVWAVLAQSPLYIILNVAVCGAWPGYPNSNTLDGYDSYQEVAYVAHYVSS